MWSSKRFSRTSCEQPQETRIARSTEAPTAAWTFDSARERGLDVVQCKHFARSTFAQLHRAAKEERQHLEVMSPQPTRYRFVTSQRLTLGQAEKIAKALFPWIRDLQDVWDGNEVDRLLGENDAVVRRDVKLWLATGSALTALLHAGTHHRSHALIAEVADALPRYVQTQSFFEAQALLRKTGTCLITGEPGIGKTTLA